ncbi:hypothetical protein SS50377_20689 [Spironucleus salmonicida]|uniref:Uncharacterized protein n=1 Tax=Spironucleus salmonicida TaxID=348837 RepID=V6LZ34_9EUKA|nr:hypothetical protein SS50377_20689 [Spironucleus salmonicida]|eukprot:EST49538.1 Hypothetical protein SS50377_10142 [Spironucleus salmonicida]
MSPGNAVQIIKIIEQLIFIHNQITYSLQVTKHPPQLKHVQISINRQLVTLLECIKTKSNYGFFAELSLLFDQFYQGTKSLNAFLNYLPEIMSNIEILQVYDLNKHSNLFIFYSKIFKQKTFNFQLFHCEQEERKVFQKEKIKDFNVATIKVKEREIQSLKYTQPKTNVRSIKTVSGLRKICQKQQQLIDKLKESGQFIDEIKLLEFEIRQLGI